MLRKKKNKHVSASAIRLFTYVSEHPEKPQVKRVDALLELLAAIRSEKRIAEKAELLRKLQETFRRYRWIREIMFTKEGTHESVTSERQQSEDDGWEYGAIHTLLLIAEYYPDHLSGIRRCEVCRRWLLARKSDHRFCSGKCRQYDNDTNPAKREKKLATMRANYVETKGRIARQNAAFGFRNKPKSKIKR